MSKPLDDDPTAPTLEPFDAERAATYLPVVSALAATGARHVPRPDWQDRVWQRIEAQDRGDAALRSPGARRFLVGGAVVAMAAGALLLWRTRPPTPDGGVERRPARLIRLAGDAAVRAESWAIGDRARIEQPANGGTIWVYRGEQTPVLSCESVRAGRSGCERFGDGVAATLVLDAPGLYHVIAAGELGAAPATYDLALAAVERAGERSAMKQTIEVR